MIPGKAGKKSGNQVFVAQSNQAVLDSFQFRQFSRFQMLLEFIKDVMCVSIRAAQFANRRPVLHDIPFTSSQFFILKFGRQLDPFPWRCLTSTIPGEAWRTFRRSGLDPV